MNTTNVSAIFFDVVFASSERELTAIDTLTRTDVQLGVETTDGAAPFFRYAPTGESTNGFPAIDIVDSNIVRLSVDGVFLDFATTNFSFGEVSSDHGRTLLIAIVELQSATREFQYLAPIAGDPLPDARTAAELEAFAAAATFSAASGQFAPNRDIVIASILDGAAASDLPSAGDDRIIGTAEADAIAALRGDDLVRGLGGGDTLKGGGGDDRLVGGAGRDKLFGGAGEDRLIGGGGADRLVGGGGRDVLVGGGGEDVLIGGRGADILKGGGGRDTFVFAADGGRDLIRNFRDGADKIKILNGAREFGDLTINQAGDDVLVRFANARIRLDDQTVADIGAEDFRFRPLRSANSAAAVAEEDQTILAATPPAWRGEFDL